MNLWRSLWKALENEKMSFNLKANYRDGKDCMLPRQKLPFQFSFAFLYRIVTKETHQSIRVYSAHVLYCWMTEFIIRGCCLIVVIVWVCRMAKKQNKNNNNSSSRLTATLKLCRKAQGCCSECDGNLIKFSWENHFLR